MPQKPAYEKLEQRITLLENELAQRKRFEEINSALCKISNAVSMTSSLDELFKSIHLVLSAIIDTTNFCIALCDRTHNNLTFPYIVDTVDVSYPPVIELDKTASLTAEVIRTRAPILMTKAEILSHRAKSRFKIHACTPSEIWLGVPLKTQGKIIGVMAVHNYHDPLSYDQTDMNVMVSVADQVAIVLERKQAEKALRESEERFSKAFNSSPAPMVISDIETGRFIDVNEQWLQMIGHTRRETIGRTSYELGIWEDPAARVRLGEQLRRKGSLRDEPIRPVSKSGDIRDVLWSAEKIDLGGNEVMLSLVFDFTERKKAEEALRESELYNKVLFYDSRIPLAVLDPETAQFIDCNNAALAINGFTERSQLLGKTPREVSPPLQYDGQPSEIAAAEKIRQALELGSAVFEWKHQSLNGAIWDTEIHLMPFVHRDRNLIQLSLQDITDRKEAEAEKEKLQRQLVQSQKMESVGRLAGGVAHDFNNMLGVILGHAELAMLKADETHPLHVHLGEIRHAAKRSAELTQQLLAFARRQTIMPKIVDLNASVTATLQMLRLLIGENIELDWLPGTEIQPVKIDPSQFDQLLMNLCVNARDAIDGVGRICIETEKKTIDEAYCTAIAFFIPGEYAVLTVSDSGCGMDKETQSKIFEPFYTTKGIGRGTGLGLATVYGIVKQNYGFINVYSEPGQGTTFRIYLPPYAGAAVEARGAEVDSILRNNDETVLVVEDEAVLLDVNTTMLRDLGYKVLPAGTPAEAIRLADEHAGRIDLLMTDVVMPEMNGRQLEQQIRKSNPVIKCLFMSGYTANVISHHGVLDEGVQFIQKPFSLKDMARKVRGILDQTMADGGGMGMQPAVAPDP